MTASSPYLVRMTIYSEEEEEFLQDQLLAQCSAYMVGLKAMKDAAVEDRQGPADCPSLLVVRYFSNDEVGDHEVVIGDFQGEQMCEKIYDIGLHAGEGVMPGSVVGTLLKDFWEEKQVVPFTVGVVADSVSTKEDYGTEETLRRVGEHKKSLHQIFKEDPLATEWLTECLNVFIMDSHGRMVAARSVYDYPDEQKPPMPRYQDEGPNFEGFVFDLDPQEVKDQRILFQIALFYTMLAYITGQRDKE